MVELSYVNEQFYLVLISVFWLVITIINAKDISEHLPNKFNGILHLLFTAPLFFITISDAYINQLVQGYLFSGAILFTTIYIVTLKYSMQFSQDNNPNG